jgi:polyisoprenoid-binding protein YceI
MKKIMILLLASFILAASGAVSAETYEIDPNHTYVGFGVSHLGLTTVKGRFHDFTGTVNYDASNPKDLEMNGTIKVESIDTGVDKRDEHLRSADFFDAEKYPEMTFISKKVERSGGELHLVGDLTIHGKTKEVKLPMEMSGPKEDPWGNQRIGFRSTVTIDRVDFGVGSMEGPGAMIGRNVDLEIYGEATKKK